MLPFIHKKDDPEKSHSTPIDVKELKKKEEKQTNDKTSSSPTGKVATVVLKPSLNFIKGDKYLLIAIGSAVFCLAGFGFWMYVQFFLSP